jgi:type III restriction enzyme
LTSFRNEDLVLQVRSDFDPDKVRLDAYEAFIDTLCGDREYQKHAIRTVCRFLAGGEYGSTAQLAEENYAARAVLGDRYGSLDGLLAALPFPAKLACSVDLATATGKSWVMYGIAQILLAEGVVDRVLLLSPSLTIEAGLRTKFKQFVADRTLRDLIPADAVFRTPEIVDANVTTKPGDICIENIHATYEHVRSSVRDSFGEGRGATTLVLNDETHHVFSPLTGDRAIKRWKEFLDSEEFAFPRIAGFSGTCYIGNDYFADVVSQYSLRTALEDGRVKQVRYVAKDENLNQNERFQKYLERHRENQKAYRDRKPLSIVVTARVAGAEALAEEFVQFLVDETKITASQAEDQVLVVTSKADHKANVARLPYVDREDDPVEWIFSVSMLTEGWDVQNVFQIVPHEKRAFNSKLLIAQVLGRGLRVPPDLALSHPSVFVFNHSSWSTAVADLVEEVLEQERRLYSYPVSTGEHAKHHFDLHNLTYDTRTIEQELKPRNGHGQVQLFKRGYVTFESQPAQLERVTVFEDALDRREYVQRTVVHYPAYTVDDVVQRLRARLKSVDADGDTSYAKEYPPKKLREIVDASLKRIGEARGLVSEQNLQQLYRAMGNMQRQVAKAVRIEREPKQLFMISTKDLPRRSTALTSFRRDATVFHDSESLALSDDADQRALNEILAEDSPYPRSADREIDNKFRFRSPVNVVLTTHTPEREFTRRLFEPGIAEKIRAWIKSPDVGFYEIAYSWRRGDHTKQGKFNPDYFIRLADSKDVLVVELKADDDDTDENKAKLAYAMEHFACVNEVQDEAAYHMKFLSPVSYDAFFQATRDGEAQTFESGLQALLLAE